MPVHIAFLRAINVGGRTVRMDALRSAFQALDLEDVSTFIASGNVVFRSRATARTLEARIEEHLRGTFGWEVATFIRNAVQLEAVLAAAPFPAEAGTTHVGFLHAAPAAPAKHALETFTSDVDALRVHDREIYWLIRGGMRDSKLSGALIEKTLAMPTTLRTLRTVQRIVTKLEGA